MGLHKTETRKLLDKINWSQIIKNYTLKELSEIFQLPQSVIQASASEHYKNKGKQREIFREAKYIDDEDFILDTEGAWMNWNNRLFYKTFNNE